MTVYCESRDCKFNKDGECQRMNVNIDKDARCEDFVDKEQKDDTK